MGLARVAESMGLPCKQSMDDYAAYTDNYLERDSVFYAVRDVILPEIIRHTFAPKGGYTTVVRCG